MRTDGSLKYLLHKTQGNGVDAAIATLHAKGAESTFVTEIRASRGRRRVQLVSLHRAAKSLANKPGGVQTNREDVVVQDEIVGFSEVSNELDYTEADWLWYGRQLRPVFELLAIPKVALPFHDYPPEDGHRLGREPWRLSPAAWVAYSGLCGHQHAPENVHGDPGNLSRPIYRNGTTSALGLILEALGASSSSPTTNGDIDVDEITLRNIIREELDAAFTERGPHEVQGSKDLRSLKRHLIAGDGGRDPETVPNRVLRALQQISGRS